MNAMTRDARHLQELQHLEQILQKLRFPTHLVRTPAPVPQAALLTRIAMPNEQEPLEMALTFYPAEPDTFQHVLLLQYYIQLPHDFDPQSREQYVLLLPDLNTKAVLGHFGLDMGSHKPHYRYVQTLPVDRALTQESVIDALILVGYTPALFHDLLAAIADKRLDAATARTQPPLAA